MCISATFVQLAVLNCRLSTRASCQDAHRRGPLRLVYDGQRSSDRPGDGSWCWEHPSTILLVCLSERYHAWLFSHLKFQQACLNYVG